jgi:protein-S-isoprenylcysteine O-methyltransferase Ste14
MTTHLFVVVYEEPALARLFGASYQEYKEYKWKVHRWLIRRPR